jgi:hypothetical protein
LAGAIKTRSMDTRPKSQNLFNSTLFNNEAC